MPHIYDVDAFVVFGSEQDQTTGVLPSHIYRCLDEAANLWKGKVAPRIIVCGKYASRFNRERIAVRYFEADEMARYSLGELLTESQVERARGLYASG